MADTKNTQTTHAGLPKKHWLTLEKVADRWSELTGETVTVDDVVHFAETNKLFVCAYLEKLPPANWLYGLPAGIDRSTVIKNMEEETANEEDTKEFRMNTAHLCAYRPFHINEYWKQGIAPASGFLYLLLDVFRVGENVKCKALGNTWLLLADGGLKPEIAGVYYTIEGNAIDMMLLDTPVTIPLNEIVLITEEIERFEQAQGIGKPTQIPDLSEPKKLDPRKEKTYLQIIRVLLRELKFDGKNPHSDAGAIQASAATHKVQIPVKTETIAKVIEDALNLSE